MKMEPLRGHVPRRSRRPTYEVVVLECYSIERTGEVGAENQGLIDRLRRDMRDCRDCLVAYLRVRAVCWWSDKARASTLRKVGSTCATISQHRIRA